jgi:hypothetical protein
VFLLEARDRWSLVEVVANAEVEGWVSNAFIAPASAGRSAVAPAAGSVEPASAEAVPAGKARKATVKGGAKKKLHGAKKHHPVVDD